MDLTIVVGGAAGQGLRSIGLALVKAGAKAGFHVFATQDYMSRIRGGHNFFRIRFSEDEIFTTNQDCHLVVALDHDSVEFHKNDLDRGGLILCDPKDVQANSEKIFYVPFGDLAIEHGGHKIMANSVALGAVWGLLGGEIDDIYSLLEDTWETKGTDVVEKNKSSALAGFEHAIKNKPKDFELKFKKISTTHEKRLVVDGSTAIGMGAIAAGCRFLSAYPMTPSTGITEYIASHQNSCNIIVEQAEDEIAALIMGIGAANAGARSLVPTSGGGFSLMVEGLGLAGITETPIVIVNMQRPGPATGLPTRTEQSDLLFAIHAHQGEFPRLVMAPHSPEEAFSTIVRAFNMADFYQIPVIVLGDQYLADSLKTTTSFDFNSVKVDRGKLLDEEEANSLGGDYKRHLLTEDGISPRAFPGRSRAIFATTGDEHDESGNIIEEADLRIAQHEKRLKKLESLRQSSRKPLEYGAKNASIALISWGSTYGAVKEAVDLINKKGSIAKMIHFIDIYPLNPDTVIEAIGGYKERIAIEGNATAQFAKLIKSETGIGMTKHVLRYDGRPITPEYIIDNIKEGGNLPW